MRTKLIYVLRRTETIGPCEKNYNVFIRSGTSPRKLVSIHQVAFSNAIEANKHAKERIQFEKDTLPENAVIAEWNNTHRNPWLIYRISQELHQIEYFIEEILLVDEELD